MLDVVSRPEQPPARGDDVPGQIQVGAGGQAANVAAWAAALGAEALLVAKRGDDAAGRLAAAEVEARGVRLLGPVGHGSSGVVVSTVEADGERTIVSAPGVAPELRSQELRMEWFRGCDVLYLSGYALLRRPIDEAGAKAAGAVRAQGGSVAVDLATWTAIRSFGPGRFRARLATLEPDVCFAGERELAELGGRPQAATLVVKRGAAGVVVERDGGVVELASRAAEVVDSTGAGDAFAAGYLVGGVDVGLEAAARCLARLGSMP